MHSLRLKLLQFCIILFPFYLFGQSRPIATNLSGVTDYSTELVFTDAFKQCRFWTPFDADGNGGWDSHVSIELREDGYPVRIPYDNGIDKPQKVRALMLWDIGESVPLGKYRLIVEGTGEVALQFGASGRFACPVDTFVQVNGGVSLSIESSDENDPVRNIRFIYPQYVNSFMNQTFYDELLEFVSDFQAIRFMDWLRTNNSTVKTWQERSSKNYFTQTMDNGVSWEYIIELCNTTKKDLWLNIPHLADDNYISSLAQMIKSDLDPDLKIYLEYSNEVWNGQFAQHHEAAELAVQLGYDGQPWERAWKYTAKRSADIFRIFKAVFGGNDRLIRLIPSQAGNSWVSNQILTYFYDSYYNPTGEGVDFLTIAPYFGGNVANEIYNEGLVQSIEVSEIVQRMAATLPESFKWMDDNKAVADNYGIGLNCYEGGQHLVGVGEPVNDDQLTVKLIAANHHPDLQDVYCQYMEGWYERSNGLFAHFSSHGFYSKWGSWGVKERYSDTLNPKYLALKACVFAHNVLSISEAESIKRHSVYPNPNDGTFYVRHQKQVQSIVVRNTIGQSVAFNKQKVSDDLLEIKMDAPSGIYFISIDQHIYPIINIQGR